MRAQVAVYSQRKAEGGTSFDVPYSLGVLREESTKDGTPAKALDLVVHPDTMALAQRNARFKTLVCDVARDAVVRGREIKLERDYYCPKGMVYKGPAEGPSVQTVRNKGKAPAAAPAATGQVKPTGVPSEVASLRAQSLPTAQTQEGQTSSSGGGKSPFSFDLAAANAPPPPRLQYADNGEVIPDHTLVHSGTLRYEEHFAVQAGVGTSAEAGARPSLPERLILTVRLPELKSAAAADLDVSPQRLVLTSEATAKFPGYRLDLTLPYEVRERARERPLLAHIGAARSACSRIHRARARLSVQVDDSAGSAKWVKDKRELRVTLPVVPPPAPAPRPFVEPAPEEPEEEGEEEEVEREDWGEVASVVVDGGGADTEQFEDPSSEGAGPGTQSDLSPAQGDPQAGDYEGSLATDGGVVAQTAVDEAPVPAPSPASAPEPALKPSFGGASFLFDLE